MQVKRPLPDARRVLAERGILPRGMPALRRRAVRLYFSVLRFASWDCGHVFECHRTDRAG
jgi:hypothetical protein